MFFYLVGNIFKMSQEQLLVHLREIEEAAEEVLSDKQEIVDLDRKRCQNREAIRAMSHLNHAGAAPPNQWLAMGNCFFKLPKDKAKTLLQKDQDRLDTQINILRSNLKPKVNNLRDKEGQPELKGHGLKALDRNEIQAVKAPTNG